MVDRIRDQISEGLKEAMKKQDRVRMTTLRLINAAIKDRDIEARTKGKDGVSNDEIMSILTKMIRQREESSKIYEENARLDLAEQERKEIEVIRSFLPRQMDDDELKSACRDVVGDVGAQGLRDMGKCMGTLKERYSGRMDFARASSVVKDILSS
ncbi:MULTISPECIES: GatB/YqeY domain-containing protein [Afifella]|uniref:GatB/YqeY domain-containing protein n=1 Tax=Afifella TaxID=643217 RepID=UPI000FE2B15D|nr:MULTISPECIES: GatB/YqeY domain-containing protein [Afifella]MCF1502573.1 GatB/YqeY domain-containing protein [Afifella sp. H1R]MCT8266149.1 GatB/YqeY domain-containing protein [Afifella sp. JA880]